jgi:mannose-6-phosphate isomerase-like protein (cupin superfamily)
VTPYTIVNLKDVEDQAPKFGLSPNLEARFAKGPLDLERSGLSYQRYAPNFRGPFGHRHDEQEEIYVILSGTARLKLEDDVVELSELDAVRVSPGTMRAFEAGPDGVELLAYGAPTPDEAEMTPGWWSE